MADIRERAGAVVCRRRRQFGKPSDLRLVMRRERQARNWLAIGPRGGSRCEDRREERDSRSFGNPRLGANGRDETSIERRSYLSVAMYRSHL
jgi:hypothetical protein